MISVASDSLAMTVFGAVVIPAVTVPPVIAGVPEYATGHHEKMDGTGYPDRLRGEEIPQGAQIICLVDVYDALTTTRSYRPAMTRAAALAELERCRHWWRPDVFQAFMGSVGAPILTAAFGFSLAYCTVFACR